MVVNYADKALTQRYQLMAQTIIPRPIAWVCTEDEKGTLNIAPFSYFMGLSPEPPTMVEGVPTAFFCEFYQEIELNGSKTIPPLGEKINPPKIP